MDKHNRLRIITKLINNDVRDRETRHRLYSEQNTLRCEIQREITRRVDLVILEGMKREEAVND